MKTLEEKRSSGIAQIRVNFHLASGKVYLIIYLFTGAFLGDTEEVYSVFFIPIVIVGILQGMGYLFGYTLFERYVRRS